MRALFFSAAILLVGFGCASEANHGTSTDVSTLNAGDEVHIVLQKFGSSKGVDAKLDEHGDVSLPLDIHVHLQGLDLRKAGDAIRASYQPDGPTEVTVTKR